MPFDDEEDDNKQIVSKVGLKATNQKSMFDGQNKKQSSSNFKQAVRDTQDRLSGYKAKAAELNSQFYKIISDKTLLQNKSAFQQEVEIELLSNLVSLANEINNDPSEGEGIGTLTILVPLMKTCLSQRNRINELEYIAYQLQKKVDIVSLTDLIKKEISIILDNKKNGG